MTTESGNNEVIEGSQGSTGMEIMLQFAGKFSKHGGIGGSLLQGS